MECESILGFLSCISHLYDSWIESRDDVDEVGLGTHYRMNVLVGAGDFVDAGGTMGPGEISKVVREIDDAIEALLEVRARLQPAKPLEDIE